MGLFSSTSEPLVDINPSDSPHLDPPAILMEIVKQLSETDNHFFLAQYTYHTEQYLLKNDHPVKQLDWKFKTRKHIDTPLPFSPQLEPYLNQIATNVEPGLSQETVPHIPNLGVDTVVKHQYSTNSDTQTAINFYLDYTTVPKNALETAVETTINTYQNLTPFDYETHFKKHHTSESH